MPKQGKKYEVILLRDLKFNKDIQIDKGDATEILLERVLNEYAKDGYRAICVWNDALIMEKK